MDLNNITLLAAAAAARSNQHVKEERLVTAIIKSIALVLSIMTVTAALLMILWSDKQTPIHVEVVKTEVRKAGKTSEHLAMQLKYVGAPDGDAWWSSDTVYVSECTHVKLHVPRTVWLVKHTHPMFHSFETTEGLSTFCK